MKFPSQIKLYRKLRYRKGYGVHSPYIYNLITKVIEEKTLYYVFEDIENFRKELLSKEGPIATLTAQETQPKNYGALLFRLVNFLKCRTILQIGSSVGVMSLYLAFPLRRGCNCYFLEERTGLLNPALTFAENHSLINFHPLEGAYAGSLQRLKTEINSFDFIFINMQGASEKTREMLHLTESFISSDTVMVIDKIRKNKAMRKLWKEIKIRQDVRLTIDLLSLGLIFFNTQLHKQHYKNYFDDGKKQNLHKERRRRFNFFGRRKKGVQNRSPR